MSWLGRLFPCGEFDHPSVNLFVDEKRHPHYTCTRCEKRVMPGEVLIFRIPIKDKSSLSYPEHTDPIGWGRGEYD